MGMSGGKKFGRASLSEINITPLVDVMLVLLIIFMVTAPMTKTGINVDLPSTEKTDSVEKLKPMDVTITKKNEIYVGTKKANLNNLESFIKKNTKAARIEADEQANYGIVAKVLSKIKNHGITDIALVTQEVQ